MFMHIPGTFFFFFELNVWISPNGVENPAEYSSTLTGQTAHIVVIVV